MMLNVLLLLLVIIHASMLFVVMLLYALLSKNGSKEIHIKEMMHNKAEIKAIERGQCFQLIKQVIDLTNFNLSFKTSYQGYLYVIAKSAILEFGDNTTIKIKNSLEKFFIDKGEVIRLINPVNLKSIRFVKI